MSASNIPVGSRIIATRVDSGCGNVGDTGVLLSKDSSDPRYEIKFDNDTTYWVYDMKLEDRKIMAKTPEKGDKVKITKGSRAGIIGYVIEEGSQFRVLYQYNDRNITTDYYYAYDLEVLQKNYFKPTSSYKKGDVVKAGYTHASEGIIEGKKLTILEFDSSSNPFRVETEDGRRDWVYFVMPLHGRVNAGESRIARLVLPQTPLR